MKKIYVIEELCFANGDLIGSAVLTKGFANRDKALEYMKALTPAEPDSVVLDEIDDARGVRVVEYDTEEVINYNLEEIEVEL